MSRKKNYMLASASVECSQKETLTKEFITLMLQNQFIRKKEFNNAHIHRIAIAMKTNSPFNGFFTGELFWYHHFNLRQLKLLRGGQPIVDYDTSDNCRLYLTAMESNISERCNWTLALSRVGRRTLVTGASFNSSTSTLFLSQVFRRTNAFRCSRQFWRGWKDIWNGQIRASKNSKSHSLSEVWVYCFFFLGSGSQFSQQYFCNHQQATRK